MAEEGTKQVGQTDTMQHMQEAPFAQKASCFPTRGWGTRGTPCWPRPTAIGSCPELTHLGAIDHLAKKMHSLSVESSQGR